MKLKYFCLLSVLFLAVGFATAQPLNKATAKSLVDAADLAYESQDYYNAYEKYNEAYEEDNNVYLAYKIALCSYNLRDYMRAERNFNRLLKKDKKKQQYTKDVRYQYARSLKMTEKYDESIEQFELFIAESEDAKLKEMAKVEMEGADIAKDMVETLGLNVEHAGKKINSKTSEYAPSLSPDGETLYFSALEAEGVVILDGTEEDYYMKVFQSKKKGDNWDKPTALDYNVNRDDFHTGNPAISPDGQRMYFTRALLEGNYLTESKIYVSTRNDEGWGASNELVGVNGNHIAKHPIVGELFGREVLYFTSNMDGGYGGYDIYYATRKGDGVYADPVNLGPKINTPSDEETPFYLDGLLYFSSDGHPGIGGFDVFKTSWDGTGWSTVSNMGQGYNSPVDDLYFRMDEEGENGFIVSNRVGEGNRSAHGKTCCNDIYTFNVAKVEASLVVGSFEGKAPLTGTKFQLIDLTPKKTLPTNTKDSGQGNKVAYGLEADRKYRIIATKEGYYPDTVEINTVGLVETKEFKEFMKLKPIPKPPEPEKPKEPLYETYTMDQPIELKNILYDFDDDKILPDAEPDLQIILDLMSQYPDMKIELTSHTDSQGKDKYNMTLSQRRASSAKRWLVQRGVNVTRVRAIGKGETEIRNQCVNKVKCTDDEHRYNRRTEFRIVEGPTTIQIEKKRMLKKE